MIFTYCSQFWILVIKLLVSTYLTHNAQEFKGDYYLFLILGRWKNLNIIKHWYALISEDETLKTIFHFYCSINIYIIFLWSYLKTYLAFIKKNIWNMILYNSIINFKFRNQLSRYYNILKISILSFRQLW